MTAFSFDILLEGKYRQTLFSNINSLPVRKRRLPEMSALTSHAAPAKECVCIQAIRVNPDCISEKSKNYYGMYGFGTYVAFNIPNGYPEMPLNTIFLPISVFCTLLRGSHQKIPDGS